MELGPYVFLRVQLLIELKILKIILIFSSKSVIQGYCVSLKSCSSKSMVKLGLFLCCRYVIVECEDQDTQQRDPKTHEMYLNVMRRFSQALLKVMPLCEEVHYGLG